MSLLEVTGGDRLHYLDVGRGPACVLLHGFGMQASHYLPFVLPLARSYRFVMIDLRGFGGSRHLKLRDADLLRSHASDVHDVITGLRLDYPALGGISMGAATSLAYLRHFGFDRVRAYLHMDQSPRILNDDTYKDGVFGEDQVPMMSAWTAVADELEAHGRDTPYARLPKRLRRAVHANLARFFSYAFHGRAWRASSALVKREIFAKRILAPENWPLYLDAMRAYQTCDYDFRPDLARIDVPTHVFVGMQSRMYPPPGQLEIKDRVPHARIVKFANAGHAVPAEAPLKFTWGLREFLRTAYA